ncbi:SRPBCC family protein [Mesorhizobium sp. J428]|uniref:SRPBCC family protein n=1 Tax=Mesorhizobium sp. J428 TaxID=2898440 RepID=UPI00215158FF|nr:SRPBCC family protein [Mesorhizobium sp. J428]MCR5858831.1 SRPBCC family protein [Mesorhizobium sp. J428]
MPSTIRLHRVLKAPPEKVYKAFVDADALCRWLPPYGFLGKIDRFEAKVGGGYHMSFRNFTTGQAHSFSVEYKELVPGKRIVHTDRFDGDFMPGEMVVTIELTEVFCGTDIRIEQAGVPDMIPEAACYLGWQESLLQLAQVVEPDIKDE